MTPKILPQPSVDALYDSGLVWNAERSAPPSEGLTKGAVHQVIYSDKFAPLSFAAQVALESIKKDQKTIFWIGKPLWPTPHFLCEVDPTGNLFHRSLFIEHADEKKCIWAAEEALSSVASGVVITSISKPNRALLKRFLIKAKTHRNILLMLQPKNQSAAVSMVTSTWEVCSMPAEKLESMPSEIRYEYEVKLISYRGLAPSSMSWLVTDQTGVAQIGKDEEPQQKHTTPRINQAA